MDPPSRKWEGRAARLRASGSPWPEEEMAEAGSLSTQRPSKEAEKEVLQRGALERWCRGRRTRQWRPGLPRRRAGGDRASRWSPATLATAGLQRGRRGEAGCGGQHDRGGSPEALRHGAEGCTGPAGGVVSSPGGGRPRRNPCRADGSACLAFLIREMGLRIERVSRQARYG